MGDAGQFRRHVRARRGALFGDFVADAPQNDAGMIAVPAQFGAPILLVPVVVKQMIIVFGLAAPPAIERLVHHHHAHAVAQIQPFGGGRVVAGADGVAAHLLENRDLAPQGADIDGRAQGAQVVMVAHAVQRHALAVEQKAVGRREFNRPNAERRFIAIHQFPVLLDGSHHHVAVGRFKAPQAGLFDGGLALGGGRLARGDLQAVRGRGGDGTAPGPIGPQLENLILDSHGGGGLRFIIHADGHVDFGGAGLHARGGHINAPVRDVDGSGLDQPDIAIDAAARIPAGGAFRVVKTNGDDVVRAEFERLCQIHAPGSIAVGPAARKMAVDPDGRVSHRAIHVQADAAALVRGGNLKMLAVPADAPPRQLAGFAGILLFERPFDAPIMRQVQQPPLAVVEIAPRVRDAAARLAGRPDRGRVTRESRAGGRHPILDGAVIQFPLRVGRVAFDKAPASVQRSVFAGRDRLRRCRKGRHIKCQQGEHERTTRPDKGKSGLYPGFCQSVNHQIMLCM